jgi:glycosyltransferase involved in cell wall biosynthesis
MAARLDVPDPRKKNVRKGRAHALREKNGMLEGKKIVVIMPAYNAAATLRQTFKELPSGIVDHVILTDDDSRDDTVEIARQLGVSVVLRHRKNRGYGANQKTCYAMALKLGADIVVMLHPDYQYSPRLVTAMTAMVVSDHFDGVLGSRILGQGALQGGMPVYKYAGNRALTLLQNMMLSVKFSEFHTGFRAWNRKLLETLPLLHCADNFVFDNQMLAQAIYFGFRLGELSCPTRYFPEASSINFKGSVIYGCGVLNTSIQFMLQRAGLMRSKIFEDGHDGRLTEAACNEWLAANAD